MARIVSFSGIDGAGKSTQIEALVRHLRKAGFRSVVYTFWDDVVALPRLREFVSHCIFRGDKGVGSVEKPIQRRDKNVRSWPVTAVRLAFHLLDALNLRRKLSRTSHHADFIIFDRYIYDELANLPLSSRLARVYVGLVLKVSPAPDIAYLIDADPHTARARKPEYPLQFLHQNRDAYLAMRALAGNKMLLIEPASVDEMSAQIARSLPPVPSRAEEETIDFPRCTPDLPHPEL